VSTDWTEAYGYFGGGGVPMSMPVELGTTTVDPGEKAWVELPVAEDADTSEIVIHACVINGGEGPTLWAQGLLHGSEHVGGLALRDSLTDIDPADVSGTIIGVPVANPPAFAAKHRLSPIDGSDVNRSFRGDPTGTFSEMLAHTLFSTAEAHADFVLDLHNGGNEYVVPGFSIFSRTDDATEATVREMLDVAGLPYAVGIDREFGGSMGTELADAGIPSAVIEVGGRGHITQDYYDANRHAIENIAKQVDVLAGAPTEETAPTYYDELEWLRTPTGGFFEPAVEANTHVEAGTVMARVTDVTGDTKHTFEAPDDAVVLCMRTYGMARPGDWAIEIAPA